MAITFGKYKDHDLANIPTNYLEWLMVNVKDLMEPLKSEVSRELASRSGNQGRKATVASLDTNQIEDVCRNLEKQFQSDTSGTNGEILKGISLLKDALLQKIK